MRIYKYILPSIKGIHLLTMHDILYVTQVQVVDNIPYLWAVVNETKPATYKISVWYTGDEPLNTDTAMRIGTAVWPNEGYVLHYWAKRQ